MMRRLLHYYCWGLNIASELACPEMIEGAGAADVHVVIGRTPESLPDADYRGVRFEVTDDQFLLRVDKVARYHAVKGERIVVEPFPDALPEEVRLFLLGSGFGALLQQRGMVPMHASVIEMNGNAVMFCGVSAVGKSTLAATFCMRGYRMLADDVCVVRIDEWGRPVAVPGYPQFKLWGDALKALRTDDTSRLTHARLGLEKYNLDAREQFCAAERPLKAVYFLTSSNESSFDLKRIQGKDKFIALFNCTYRIQFLDKLINKSFHYRICTAIAQYADMVHLIRPDSPFVPEKIADLVEEDLLS